MRLDSVSRAADELSVSQPAISQRLRTLDRYFGRSLIERTSTGFTSEPDVEVFAARLRSSFDELRAASATFQADSRQAENRITIALLATFAQRWLIPRLLGFQQQYPHFDVHLMTTSSPADLDRPDADVSIRCGSGQWPGCKSEFLAPNRIFPVASPGYLRGLSIKKVADLRKATCIRVDAPPRDRDWSRWLSIAGGEAISPKAWQNYSNSTHAMEAATAGLGVAMAHSPFVTDSLSSGRLVKLFDHECDDTDGDYYLVYKATADVPRRIRQFCDWLTDSRVK
jgi:LysR family transcriptional regulator, glycine cleavage system transcriptional activator